MSIYKSPAGEIAIQRMYDAVLARWPVQHETRCVPTRHGDTFVIVSGEASLPPLVLLHGASTNSSMWIGDIAAYSRSFRTYAVDLIGEPGKSAPNRPAWQSDAYAVWLCDVFDGLGIERAGIVGLSQGGWTALKFATAFPERTASLVLINPGGVVPDRALFLPRLLVLMLLGRWGIHRMNQLLFGGQPVPDGVDHVTGVIMANFNGRVGTLPIFADEALRRLVMPVLLVAGGRDPLRDAGKIAARLQAVLPKLTAQTIPDGGHALVNIAPRVVAFLTT